MTHIGQGERAYHIFYQVLKGMNSSQLKELHLPSDKVTEYKYIGHGDGNPGKHDQHGLAEVADSFDKQAIEKSEQQNFWQLVAGILLLGNVQFDPSKSDAATVLPASAKSLQSCEAVLGLNPNTIGKALTKKKIKAGSDFV